MAVVIDQHCGITFKPLGQQRRLQQRCRLQSLTHFNFSSMDISPSNPNPNPNPNLASSLKCVFATFHRSFSTPCLSSTHHEEDYFIPTVSIIAPKNALEARALILDVAIAFASGVDPTPVSNGLGGAYLIRTRHGESLAVAKPVDEEPLAFNNPKGFVGQTMGQPGFRRSIRVGETGIRELSAYLLDHDSFAGVPPTALVAISHSAFHVNNGSRGPHPQQRAMARVSNEPTLTKSPHCQQLSHIGTGPKPFVQSKMASLQRFVDHESDAGDLGPSGFSVVSVHRIGILDIRILNLDRHAGNILVRRHGAEMGSADLVPIDHGLCLPEWLDNPYFEWLHWPQASVPFSENEMEYIRNLDPTKDMQILVATLPSFPISSIRILVICTIFLKAAAGFGLCLSDIGQMMSREPYGGDENLSALESICAEAYKDCKEFDEKSSTEEEDKEEVKFDEMFFLETEENPKNNVDLGRPPKIPKFPSRSNLLLDGNDCEENFGDQKMRGGLTKSMSFAFPKQSHEVEGIYFGDMSGEEWEAFLVLFQKLLPEAFQEIKATGLKPRLGTSCEF